MTARASAEQLTSCDREPIHTPGAIQGHGVMLAASASDERIQGASANADQVFGKPPETLLGASLSQLLGAEQWERLRNYVARGTWSALQPITLTIPHLRDGVSLAMPWDTFVHRRGGLLVFEFEPSAPAIAATPCYRHLRSALGRLHATKGMRQLCEAAAIAVRQITGYDLVMVYRFDKDWNGEVFAEAKKKGLRGYLGHHFPASDIPKQAREVFFKSWVRGIPDVGYAPVPFLAVEGLPPLDMSKAMLRSVSPVHIQYLKNMGSQATLTVSLRHRGRLWGLIACHHSDPLHLFYEPRLACELVGKTVSSLLAARQLDDERAGKRLMRKQRSSLGSDTEMKTSLRETLETDFRALLGAVGAQGAAVRVDAGKEWLLLGKTPSRGKIQDLAAWLEPRMEQTAVFATSHLASECPFGAAMHRSASGLLAISIPKAARNFIMWFRPEEAQTKIWAGDPEKRVTMLADGSVKIEPRHSFEAWKESIKMHARPWTRGEVASAVALRSKLMAQDLHRQFQLAQQAVRVRDDFLCIASHELKTPLTAIRLQTQLGRRRLDHSEDRLDVEKQKSTMERIDQGADRLTHLVDDMLDMSRISTGQLAISTGSVEITALVRDVTERMRVQFEAAQVPLEVVLEERAEGDWDRLRIEQVLWNLLSNAIRYGNRSPVFVRAGRRNAAAYLEVRDEGPGIERDKQQRIFEKFERADAHRQAFGLGLGLHICKHIVELHDGQIGVTSCPSQGSTFLVTLPTRTA